jgi:hypothetical protein
MCRIFAPQFTPLYAGILNTTAGTDPVVGGGYVEPLLLNTYSPGPQPTPASGVANVTATSAPYVVPLVQMVGISSSFAAQGTRPDTTTQAELTGAERLEYWNLVRGGGRGWGV